MSNPSKTLPRSMPALAPAPKVAPHVLAALAWAQPKAEPGKAHHGLTRPMAPHVQAAIGAGAQPKVAPSTFARPIAPHVRAAVGFLTQAAAQPRWSPAGGRRGVTTIQRASEAVPARTFPNVLRVCRVLKTKWLAFAADAEQAAFAGNWAVTGSAAHWLLSIPEEDKPRNPNDVDILVDGNGMINAHYILTEIMKMETGQGMPSGATKVRTFQGADGTKVDMINVTRFAVPVDLDSDVALVLGIPVLKKEKLMAFQAKREQASKETS
jgi:hypothetical protein